MVTAVIVVIVVVVFMVVVDVAVKIVQVFVDLIVLSQIVGYHKLNLAQKAIGIITRSKVRILILTREQG